jgi:nickel/cobalt exporter
MSSRRLRARLSLTALLAVVLLIGRTASAHPAGFTSINRYIGVECNAQGRPHVAYLLDFAEFPAYAEIEALDADHDGTVTPAEQRAYLDRRLGPLVEAWTVEVNGLAATARVAESNLEVLPGERGLSTLRIAADVAIVTDRPGDAGGGVVRVRIRDPAFADRSGWREMAAEDSGEATVISGPKARPADALAYANPAAGGPPRVDEASFAFRLRAEVVSSEMASRPAPPVVVDARLSQLSSAMKRARGSPSFSALALALAFALGAAHALSPGHGKAMAAAYLVGGRAGPQEAVLFGISVTVAHTAVVFLVGCLALGLERTVGSDRLLRDLELASAVTIVAVGIVQLSRRWREATGDARPHDHAPTPSLAAKDGPRSMVALGVSSGLTPCPSALAVLLAAIAIHRYGFGLILVLAFSLGVALTLTGTGLMVVMARRLLDRMAGAAPILRWLPVMSSTCVLLIGIVVCASMW